MSLHVQETLIAGGSTDAFPTVRHLVLRGSNQEIGRHLATLARERYGTRLQRACDPRITHARRRYLQQHYPILAERVRGVADAYGISLHDDETDPGALLYPALVPARAAGCSAVFYPPGTTTNGHGLLSRNLDAQTGSMLELLGLPLPLGVQPRPTYGEPYVMEVYPDAGYPSLYLACMDLLGACFDGVNAAGLTVSLLGDGDPDNTPPLDRQRMLRVGINELQVSRLLLDTCASVEEAQQALLLNKHYTAMLSCHYIVADRHGRSFIWEHAAGHNLEYLLDGSGAPLVVTNHPLHTAASQAPEHRADRPATWSGDTYARHRTLSMQIAAQPGSYSVDFLKEANACVFLDDAVMREYADLTRLERLTAGRTLWHSVYDTHESSLEVSFFLRDEPDGELGVPLRASRSPYVRFQLDGE